MTKKELRKRTRALIRESAKSMEKNLERVLHENMVNPESWDNENWLPRIVLQALLSEEKHQYPLRDNKEKNLAEQIIYAQL